MRACLPLSTTPGKIMELEYLEGAYRVFIFSFSSKVTNNKYDSKL